MAERRDSSVTEKGSKFLAGPSIDPRYPQLMAQSTSISLYRHLADFLAREVASGRYRCASEVVQAGLRLFEGQQARMASLRSALADGEASGTPEPFDFDAFVAGKRGRLLGMCFGKQCSDDRVARV